ncbi:hypothetical protein D7X96_21420 [Corallococcus interemptor]|uniref:Transposase n=1 Tax=Corallococcus interemptor TaxID=2316720 RepID=A0A3A8QEU7_9BACT|nr:hypothetical protein D7X96_21420 [Corallococcus interemptor]
MVLEEDKMVGQMARDLDLTATALRTWVERARADRGQGKPGALTTAEREELARLRKENCPRCAFGDVRRSPRPAWIRPLGTLNRDGVHPPPTPC